MGGLDRCARSSRRPRRLPPRNPVARADKAARPFARSASDCRTDLGAAPATVWGQVRRSPECANAPTARRPAPDSARPDRSSGESASRWRVPLTPSPQLQYQLDCQSSREPATVLISRNASKTPASARSSDAAPSTVHTRASTKAGVATLFTSDALFAVTNAHATHRRVRSTDAAGANRASGSCKHKSGHERVDVSTAAVGVSSSAPRPPRQRCARDRDAGELAIASMRWRLEPTVALPAACKWRASRRGRRVSPPPPRRGRQFTDTVAVKTSSPRVCPVAGSTVPSKRPSVQIGRAIPLYAARPS